MIHIYATAYLTVRSTIERDYEPNLFSIDLNIVEYAWSPIVCNWLTVSLIAVEIMGTVIPLVTSLFWCNQSDCPMFKWRWK